jgi:hypothetical protein
MSILISIQGDRVFVKPVAEEPGMNVDAPEREIPIDGKAYGLTYEQAIRHGSGEMKNE